MSNLRSQILVVLLLFFSGGLCYAQKTGGQYVEKRYNIFFRINSSEIKSDFRDNDRTLETLRNDVHTTMLQDGAVPDSLLIISSASPDGGYDFNRSLAQNRAANTQKMILEMFPDFKNANIEVKYLEEDWDGLLQVLKAHPDFPQREEMLRVILDDDNVHSKELRLRELKQGWKYLVDNYIHALRNSSITLKVVMTSTNADDEYVRALPARVPLQPVQYSYVPTLECDVATDLLSGVSYDSFAGSDSRGQRHLYLKTNTLGLALAISNIACEIDIAKHFSISVPIYYSALNYFTETIKFRTLATQPEIRYWTNANNNGFFLGLHGGVAQYNLAVDGDLRYQDHNGTEPAVGGGIGLGYRMPISEDNRWHIEFALGAGIYKLHYDTFHNVHNGKYIDSYHKIYYGLDNAAVNISYRFDLKKRKK